MCCSDPALSKVLPAVTMKLFPMKRVALITRKYSRSAFLCALVGLCLSLSGSLRAPATVNAKQGDAGASFISAGTISLRAHALTSSRDARTETLASKQGRGKNSQAHLTASLPDRFGMLKPTVHRLALRSRASLTYSSLSISRPKGRAPPQII